MSDDIDGFERELDELVQEAEAWFDSIGLRVGLDHVERLRGYEARAADIERRIMGMNSAAFADLLVRATNVRANLEIVIRKATGQFLGPRLDAALQACRDALAGLGADEKRAALTVLMAEVAATDGAPF
jgi:hypothetical protein